MSHMLARSAVGLAICAACLAAPAAQTGAGRALRIEDYYRVQNVAGTQISPDGRWVLFTVSTRVEVDQATRSELHVVPADGSARARRVQHEGRDVANGRWNDDNQIESPISGIHRMTNICRTREPSAPTW